ncbi:MAG: DUF2934 domain-containing protein [Candidatus Thiodiazotropha endolucinida]|uniref:Uncharacterized protein n=3 Tax=Candidatus Thiodiazotropha TaxID=1913444 RepID=A0A7Z1AGT0_9GAMM|nr:DUF2934 domain-containing protein [Candidatus Thiodiazotropha endolucinida]MCG7861513.1 DUF2934 domain-containing protein [Candidatus Thiodiazotropha endolucinida]MCG7979306.1 DUF2934 domain-containing protein [Candidatus Thiodiazotropha taylori]MCW4237438.1 DUF2934 domain-containing protein [Candidatus Thiodiazotropha endolucinida]ODJ88903.1 hypothetical protein CODIS_10010 [Candidatus Thiodiazotropha endolucinida]
MASKQDSNTKKSTTTKKTKAKVSKKKVTKKKAISKKRVAKKTMTKRSARASISPRERYEMIATMAYYRAEQRNFEPGHDVEDWLECESIIDSMLGK